MLEEFHGHPVGVYRDERGGHQHGHQQAEVRVLAHRVQEAHAGGGQPLGHLCFDAQSQRQLLAPGWACVTLR